MSDPAASTTAQEPHSPPLYFGYGSNLWLEQMRARCPGSTYLGIARLGGWRWIINSRGYANVIESPGDEVYGMVYALTVEDERRLDRSEGVPVAYGKEILEMEFWREKKYGEEEAAANKEMIGGLVYVDRTRTEEGQSKEEYVDRMNEGILDALRKGIPKSYVEKYLRQFIPEEDEELLAEATICDPFLSLADDGFR